MENWKLLIKDEIAQLTLNTEKKGNRLAPGVFQELDQVLKDMDVTKVRGLILDAAGDDFSQGFDLSFMLSSDNANPSFLLGIFDTCNRALDRLCNLAIPTLSVIKGSCVGGGMLIALATDFRVTDSQARFGFPEVKQSLVVNLGLQRVYRLLGECRTKELVLLGEMISAKRFHEWGATNWIVDHAAFEEQLHAFKKYVHSTPPLAIQANKDLIHNLDKLTFEKSLEFENMLQIKVLQSDDFSEAISSFLEKREPVFQGK